MSTLVIITIIFTGTASASSEPNITRLGGIDRFDTAIQISKKLYKDGVSSIIIVNGLDFPDALSASVLSGAISAPILFTTKNKISSETLKEIERLNPTRIYIVGGTSAVSASIENILKDKTKKVQRVGGKDRYETAAKVAQIVVGNADEDEAFLCTGLQFKDALSIASIATRKMYPIFFTNNSVLDESTIKSIKLTGIHKIYVVGELKKPIENTLSSLNVKVEQLGVANYSNMIKWTKKFHWNINKITLATSKDYPDVLAGCLLSARQEAPIIFFDGAKSSSEVSDLIKSVESYNILGGEEVISQHQINLIQKNSK